MSVQSMRMFLIAASALAAVAGGSPATAAGLNAGASALTPDPLGGPSVTDSDFQTVSVLPGSPRPGSLHASAAAGGFGALSVAEATTDFGVNRVFAKATAPDLDFLRDGGNSAFASSQWSDELTIFTPAPGGFLSVEFQFHAFTNQSSFNDPGPALEYIFQIVDLRTGTQQTPYRLAMDANGVVSSFLFPSFREFELTGDNDGDVLRLVGLRIPFAANQAFVISSRLTCQARGRYHSGSVQTCDANSTSLWGGITGVTDLNGDAVTDWTAMSTSGADYTRSLIPPRAAGVPEPATWAMLIMGFAAVGTLVRKDARQRRAVAQG